MRSVMAVIALLAALAATPSLADTLIRDVRVFDGERVIAHDNVLISGGKIVAVGPKIAAPKGGHIVNGKGKTLLPGLIDGHVHMSDASAQSGALGLEQAALYGVTTVLDMGTADPTTFQSFKRDIKAGKYRDGADLFTAGPPATAPGGHGDMRHKNPTLTAPDQAEAWVAELVRTGSDYIKIISETFAEHGRNVPTLSDATIAALITAAHKHGKMAVMHTLEQKRATNAVLAGVDGLVHISPYNPPDPDFGRLMKAHGVFQSTNLISYAPVIYKAELAADPDLRPQMTKAMIDGLEHAKPFADAKHEYSMAALKELTAAGVPIIAGTDIGYPYAPLLHAELAIMVRDGGMTPLEALKSATSVPARIYKLVARGRIAKGMRADLLLVEGDPTHDIMATRHIVTVWAKGHMVDRAAIVKAVMAAPPPPNMGPPSSPAAASPKPL